MKNLKYISITIAVFSLLIVSSCKKSFWTDANINPNAPIAVPPSALLVSAEGELAYNQGSESGLFAGLFDQQLFGAARQSQAYYQYIVTNQDVDNSWGEWYTHVMSSERDLMTQADAKGLNEYSGIARILIAYTLQVMTDAWGDIPYSQANQGTSNLNPAYDKAAGIYGSINGLVDDGIAKLNAAPGGIVPSGADDIIFAGNEANWIKFGHAIKARIAIHQSKGNNAMATTALAEVGLSFATNADNAQFAFGATQNNSGPWYQFNQERGGDVDFTNSTLANIMAGYADPRYNVYYDSTFNDVNGVGLGAYYGNSTSPTEFITYDELQFIAAEANLRLGNAAAAQTAFTAAITANMQKLGVSGGATTTYLAAHGILPVVNADAIDSVAKQEWIALFLNPEAWTTWRRTGSPVLTPVAGPNASNGVARRFVYPQTEIDRNGANVPAGTLWAPKLFWDN